MFGLLDAIWTWLAGTWYAFVAWLTNLGLEFADWVESQVPPELWTWLEQEPWTPFLQFMDMAAWIFPLYEAVGIWLTGMSIVVAIRLIRFVLRIAPVVNG